MMAADCPELERFTRGEVDARDFPHHEHVRMAFEMLRRHDFPSSALLYSRALRTMTANAGKPQAFNQTVTIAFLSLIAECMERHATADYGALVRACPQLLDKGTLRRWYGPQRLASAAARNTFLLPDRCHEG
jgi:hypothetical protein